MIKANGKVTKSLESGSCFLHLESCICTADTLYEHYVFSEFRHFQPCCVVQNFMENLKF